MKDKYLRLFVRKLIGSRKRLRKLAGSIEPGNSAQQGHAMPKRRGLPLIWRGSGSMSKFRCPVYVIRVHRRSAATSPRNEQEVPDMKKLQGDRVQSICHGYTQC